MKHFVLDSFALLVFFEKQKDWEKVENYLLQANSKKIHLSMSLINYGEIYYITAQNEGIEKAELVIELVNRLPITIEEPDKKLTLDAALIKSRGGISYADCFAASLAKKHNAKLITGDKEFKKLEGEINIIWIEK
jgi:uncharacterized protein